MSLETKIRARKTFFYDCIRGPFNNIVYTGLMTLALLMAKRYYGAPEWVKSLIASADSIGRLITPLTLYIGFYVGLRTSTLAALYMAVTGLFLMVVGLSDNIIPYTISIVLSYILFAQPPKLMLQIYSQNYPSNQRGKKVSHMFALSLFIGIILSLKFGFSLDKNISNFHEQFLVLAACAIISAFFILKIPSTPLDKESSGNAWQNFSLVWKDKLFGAMTIGYILLGIGTGMVVPIRIEYMADPKFLINASNFDITLINVFITGGSMLVSTQIWGIIFDRLHFIKTRLLINLCFIVSFLTFFASTNLIILGISNAINGFALAGGMLAWNLWVTKVVPVEKTPAYMSAHMSFSGIKGLIAPSIGYFIMHYTNPLAVGVIAAGLMVFSCLIYIFG